MMKSNRFSKNTANPIQGSLGNIFLRKAESSFLALLFLGAVLTGCGEKYTYPAGKVPQSIEQICLKEYQIKVKARVVGKTVGALVHTNALVDTKGQISKTDNERIGKVLPVLTRVALSSDLPLDYAVVVLRDRVHNNELTITRSMDDVRRSYADALGIEEAMNRTLFSQARFQDDPVNESKFVLREVTQEDFLAQQISQRIKMSFYKEITKDTASLPLVIADGHFGRWDGKRTFRFSIMALKTGDPEETILAIFKVVNQVLGGYRYTAFDQLEILDYMNRQKLIMPTAVLTQYQNKKITETEILKKYLMEAESVQDAFKLFGFNIPKDGSETEASLQTPAPAR